MKTDKITVFKLFETQRQYLVPIFQRGYVWTKTAQWEPLWEDILDQAELLKASQTMGKNAIRKHFLGAIVLSQVPTGIKQVPASEIIDGQQRLLTLQVFLAALRDAVINLGDDYLRMQLDRLTGNPPPFSEGNPKYKVWPTNAYRETLINVMTSGSPENLASKYPQRKYYGKLIPPRPELVEAYLYFSSVIKDFLNEMDEETVSQPSITTIDGAKQRANILYEAIIGFIQLVAIELESEDDPQVIFETLNYRGVPLEPSDLIRNFFFLRAARQEKDVNELYDRWWKGFDQISGPNGSFWKEKERQGRFYRSRLDFYFFHYLTYKTMRDIKIGHLYQEFKDWWDNSGDPRTLEEELEKVQRSSEVYRSFSAINDSGRFGVMVQRLKILDTTTVYPFLLWLCDQSGRISQEEFDGILTDIESYIVRRAICELTPKNYNRTFLTLLTKLSKEPQPSRAAMQRELLSLEGESGVWPDDKTFTEHLMYHPIYNSIGPKRVKLVLTAVELASRTPKQEVIPLAINNLLTIEHVMPQTMDEENWPYPNPIVEVKEKIQRLNLIHSLGNLTLLTQPLNSNVSNGPFLVKRPAIAGQSLLILNSYFQKFSDDDIWNENTIIERGKVLSELILKIWPYPGP
jgi:uncharacterized protein with ParB-like and HNH nuclease domain